MTTGFDPEAKERELRAESSAWDTAILIEAEPGDIPVVDMAAYLQSGALADLESAAAVLRTASEEVGFFQLVGHGMSRAQLDSGLEATRRFHALPLDTKLRVEMDRPDWPIGGSGYLPYQNHKLPARDKGNLNEAFIIKSDLDVDFDDNQWLAEDTLPGFRADVEAYAAAITEVALRLVPVYAVALDLDPGFFRDAFTHPFWRLRMSHYPPHKPAASADEFGIAPHVDTTFFTLLLPDGPGLNIFSHRRNRWIKAPVVPDAFVVNSGELLRQWSNDRVLSTRHFANNTAPVDRYSIPFFFNANSDYPMECLPSCQSRDNPAKYPAISYRESQGVLQGE